MIGSRALLPDIGSVFIVLGLHAVGDGSGLAGAPLETPVCLTMILSVLLVFMIMDLDRPRRGLIKVNRKPMDVPLAPIQENGL